MITIEFSFVWILCAVMVFSIFIIIYGIIIQSKDLGGIILGGVTLILLADGLCMFGSAFYMSHPTNGYITNPHDHTCAEFNYSTNSFDNYQPCIMPTPQDNPYEKQPLHPIAWSLGFILDLFKAANGAVNFKVT
jgi:hypothetical protein